MLGQNLQLPAHELISPNSFYETFKENCLPLTELLTFFLLFFYYYHCHVYYNYKKGNIKIHQKLILGDKFLNTYIKARVN